MTSSPSAARSQSAVSPRLTPREISLLTHSVTLTLTQAKKNTYTGTQWHTHTLTLYAEGNYDESIIWYKTEGKKGIAWWNKRKDYSSASGLSLSLSLHGLNRALSHSSQMTSAVSSHQREEIWFRLPGFVSANSWNRAEIELKWRSRNSKSCFKAISLLLCNYCTKY